MPVREGYEYERLGTCNIFVAVEPRGGKRLAQVTERRTKADFVGFVLRLLDSGYGKARTVHLVLDNLNTHFRDSFEKVLGVTAAARLLSCIEIHTAPKRANWLNMAEIEIGILSHRCLARRGVEKAALAAEVAAWQKRRNAPPMWHRVDLYPPGRGS